MNTLAMWVVVSALAAIVLALMVVAPYQLWKEKKQRTDRFKARQSPKLKLQKIVEHIILAGGKISQRFFLDVENIGVTPLGNCIVRIDNLRGNVPPQFSPRALRTSGQEAKGRSGYCNLKGGERTVIPLCYSEYSREHNFGQIFIEYKDGTETLDPVYEYQMLIGLYSEVPPTPVRLKFENAGNGLIKCSLVRD